MKQPSENRERIVVVRSHFRKLLAFPKPLRDQLLIELPTLEAFRTGEVSSLRAEYVDFEAGDLLVMDSKKKKLCMVPLDPTVAAHLAEYMRLEDIRKGIIIQPKKNANHVGRKPGSKTLGEGLSETMIKRVWGYYCGFCNIPMMPPRYGRAYFATVEHFVMGKPLAYIQFMLRHDDLQSTEHYVCNRIVSYEDMKGMFYNSKDSLFGSECARSMSCPVSCPGCSCRFFQPIGPIAAQ